MWYKYLVKWIYNISIPGSLIGHESAAQLVESTKH